MVVVLQCHHVDLGTDAYLSLLGAGRRGTSLVPIVLSCSHWRSATGNRGVRITLCH